MNKWLRTQKKWLFKLVIFNFEQKKKFLIITKDYNREDTPETN